MAAVLTGTPVAVTWASGANPAGQSITIPSDATAVVMCAAFWASTQPSGLSSATLNGNAPSRSGQLTTGQLTVDAPATMYAIWDAPATGSRTIDVAWTVSPGEGPTCIVFFVKDCDVASNWGIQLDHDQASTAVTVTLTTESGELCVAFDTREGTAPGNSSGWTSAQTHSNNSYASRLKYISASGASQVVNSENEAYSGLIGFAIPAGAVGEDDPTITDVDTDEVVLDGQTSVAVTGTDMGADETERTFTLRQGSTSVPQTETGSGTDTAATLTIGIEQSGADIKFGSATLRVTRTDDDAYGEIAITVNPPTGQLYVDLGTLESDSYYRITAIPDLETGDQLWIRGVGGGAAPTGLHVDSSGRIWYEYGYEWLPFEVAAWDHNDATWSDFAVQGLFADEIVAVAFDSVTLSDEAEAFAALVAAAADTLSLSDEADALATLVATAQDSMSLSDEAEADALYSTAVTAEDTLTLSDEAEAVATLVATAEDTLSLSDEAEAATAFPATAEDSLSLSDEAAAEIAAAFVATAADTLSLSDEAEVVATLVATAEDSLSVSDEAEAGRNLPITAEDTLSLSDEAAAEITTATVTTAADTLSLSDEAEALATLVATAHDAISVSDEAEAASVFPATAEDTLSLSDEAEALATSTVAATAEDTLSLSDSAIGDAVIAVVATAQDALSLSDESAAILNHAAHAADTLSLFDAAASTMIRVASGEDTLSFSDSALGAFERMLQAEDAITLSDSAYALNTQYLASIARIEFSARSGRIDFAFADSQLFWSAHASQ